MAAEASDFAYVRREMVAPLPPPDSASVSCTGLRTNLFATVTDSILSLLGLLAIAYFIPPLLDWLFFSAQWTGSDRCFCATVAQGGIQPDGWAGACWAFVGSKFGQFMFNVYPQDERWRVILCGVLLVVLLVPFLMPRLPYKGINALLLFVALPIVGYFCSSAAPSACAMCRPDGGGFMVTIVLSYVGIVVSLPLGVVLALGRRSRLPWSRRVRRLHRDGARRAADHRALHGDQDAAALHAERPEDRRFPLRPDRRCAVCLRLHGRSHSRRAAGDSQGPVRRRGFAWAELRSEDAADHLPQSIKLVIRASSTPSSASSRTRAWSTS